MCYTEDVKRELLSVCGLLMAKKGSEKKFICSIPGDKL